MRYFSVMILGPSQSPYEGGVFKLELFLPEEYPMAAPKSLEAYYQEAGRAGRDGKLADCRVADHWFHYKYVMTYFTPSSIQVFICERQL